MGEKFMYMYDEYNLVKGNVDLDTHIHIILYMSCF